MSQFPPSKSSVRKVYYDDPRVTQILLEAQQLAIRNNVLPYSNIGDYDLMLNDARDREGRFWWLQSRWEARDPEHDAERIEEKAPRDKINGRKKDEEEAMANMECERLEKEREEDGPGGSTSGGRRYRPQILTLQLLHVMLMAVQQRRGRGSGQGLSGLNLPTYLTTIER